MPGPSAIGDRKACYLKDPLPAKLTVLLAWLSAFPGHRAPTANIPITILDSLNREADLSALQATNLLKRKRGEMATNEAQGIRSGTSYESESELLIFSGQWPSSPDRNQPPLDSDMGSANFLEVYDKARSVAPSTPGSLTRKIPNLSPSSSVIAIMPIIPMSTLITKPYISHMQQPTKSIIIFLLETCQHSL